MIWLYQKQQKRQKLRHSQLKDKYNRVTDDIDWPKVSTQIPVYNEYNVVQRVIQAVCEMDYPKHLHQIQILDDSNDETRLLIDEEVKRKSEEGFDISIVRRQNRQGFKAGALNEAHTKAKGEYIAVFDADFVPPKNFLRTAVPYFLEEEEIGLVQARWGHLNANRSLVTRAQSLGIDGHFMIEQSARSWNTLFMNFNGTAGIWRKKAIEAGGGWQWDTLTEDMDLSYRVQLAGWKTEYLQDLVVPAELPEEINAFKSQQFRWAKGSIQTAKKILPKLWHRDIPKFKKAQAFFHMTHYMVHPMMLTMAILSLPILKYVEMEMSTRLFIIIAVVLGISMMAPNMLYVVSQKSAYEHWKRRLVFLPVLVVIGVGIAISNTKAVLEALIGRETDFIRTPKRGDHGAKDYKIRIPWLVVIELSLGVYCVFSLKNYLLSEKYLVGPFLAIYAVGFLFIGLLTLCHGLGLGQRKQSLT